MLNNYLEKRAGQRNKKIWIQGWEAIKNGFRAHPKTATGAALGATGLVAAPSFLAGNLTAGDSAETLAALDKAKKDLVNERAKGIADHAGDNIGVYALAGTGLLGLGALGAYLASKSDKE